MINWIATADRTGKTLQPTGPAITAALPYNVGYVVASVTLTGASFALTDVTVTMVIALADCSTTSWTTATSVACIGMRGSVLPVTSGVSIAGVVGTTSSLFSFDG